MYSRSDLRYFIVYIIRIRYFRIEGFEQNFNHTFWGVRRIFFQKVCNKWMHFTSINWLIMMRLTKINYGPSITLVFDLQYFLINLKRQCHNNFEKPTTTYVFYGSWRRFYNSFCRFKASESGFAILLQIWIQIERAFHCSTWQSTVSTYRLSKNRT